MVSVFFVTAPFVDLDAIASRLREATAASQKPVVVIVETISRWYGLIEKLRQSGLPVYEFAEDGSRALAALARYADLRDRPREEPPALDVDRAGAEAILARFAGRGAYLPQVEAFAVLSAYGIPTPRLARVSSPADLDAAARSVGFPCVLKVDSADVVHKSDEGGVALDLRDPAALREAFRKMSDRFAGRDVTWLVQEQKAPGCEVIIGSKAAPGLGGLVLFGLGGVLVEVLHDVRVAVSPLCAPEAREMIRGIAGFPVLAGVRGRPGVDLEALTDLLLRASRLAADLPGILEMDINPIFVHPPGTPPSAVDVRIKVS